jgi:hypothetical protein
MAELLTNEGWVRAESAGAYLRETLPDDYYVVAEPRVAGHPLAAAVVGRTALFAVEDLARDDLEVADGRNGAATGSALDAMRRFLRDEFPALAVTVLPVRSARDWSEGPAIWRVLEPPEWADAPLAEAIVAADNGAALGDAATREELAVGLRDRRLTSSQTTQRPFIFRSGGKFRTGAKVRTVRDAVMRMDRYPADGAQVLRDGTLAAWLEAEGAHHLAALARDVIHQPKADARIALESFLLGSGLVARPRLVAKPPSVDLGFVAQGRKIAHRLRLETAHGSRGYLFGAVAGGDPWLRVEPRDFSGAPVELVVTAETDRLEICPDPYRSTVTISSSASADAIAIPVTLRVVAEPPPLIRYVARPLVGALAGALIGSLLGLLWRVTGLVEPQNGLLWSMLLALILGVAGGIRGLRQPPAWPMRYALRRWLLKALAWSVTLGAVAAIVAQAWQLGLGGGLSFVGLTLAAAGVAGAAFGFGPATLDELAHSGHARDAEYVHGRTSIRRPVFVGAGVVAVLLVALLTPRLVAGVLSETNAQSTLRTGSSWVEQRLEGLGNAIDRLIQDATLRYYDRPAGGTTAPGAERPGIKLPKILGGS